MNWASHQLVLSPIFKKYLNSQKKNRATRSHKHKLAYLCSCPCSSSVLFSSCAHTLPLHRQLHYPYLSLSPRLTITHQQVLLSPSTHFTYWKCASYSFSVQCIGSIGHILSYFFWVPFFFFGFETLSHCCLQLMRRCF